MVAMTISEYSAFFKVLSEPVRVRILYLILERGELCVCDIVLALDLSQSVVSRHLAYMRNSGLVSARREGVWMYYQLTGNTGFTGQILGLLQADARHQQEMIRDLERLSSVDACCN